MRHPELLLFIHDQEAQIAELYVFGKKAMSSNEDIDLAGCQLCDDLSLLFGTAEPAEHLDIDGESRKALFETYIMLVSQNGGRSQNSHLFPIKSRLEGGSHRYFGFPEPYVTAKETVHGNLCLHISEDLLDGCQLIGRFWVFKGFFKLAVPMSMRRKSISSQNAAFCVELE